MTGQFKKLCTINQTKFSFGATAAIITNLGLIKALQTGPGTKLAIVGSIVVVALADNIADSTAIHIFRESECMTTREVWASTISNFLTRVLVSLTFCLIIIFLPLKAAVNFSMVWGLFLLSAMSFTIARNRKVNPYLAVFEHLVIALGVIILSGYLGRFIHAHLHLA